MWLDRKIREQMGECKNDPGGYFIIGGKEKVVIPQEKFGDNKFMLKTTIMKLIVIVQKLDQFLKTWQNLSELWQ